MEPAAAAEDLPSPRAFLLSHHLPARYRRTLPLPGTHGRVRLCARCTGQVTGGVLYAAVVLLGVLSAGVLQTPAFQVVWAVAPLPAAVDWTRQSVWGRESTNARRLASGALLGAAFLDVAFLVVTRSWIGVAAAVGVFVAYALGVAAVLFVSGAWRHVLADHLPGVALPPE